MLLRFEDLLLFKLGKFLYRQQKRLLEVKRRGILLH
jgi:hypothetical protein